MTQKVAINNPGPGVPDGQLRMEDDDIGYAFNLGALWEPAESTRFGLTYRSHILALLPNSDPVHYRWVYCRTDFNCWIRCSLGQSF
ncbi:MAG: hypothetical protein GY792_22750 [Gammaproteobacteria bacterium]|nr:hypothetical protein [Gammaproteobacteria bacterium]